MSRFTKEQIFVVTGASSGIGEGVALRLVEDGATVIGIGRNRERLTAMKAKSKFPENVILEQKDLAVDIPELPAYVKSLKEKYGKFAGLAYCAGIGEVSPLQLWDYDKEMQYFKTNYFAPMAMLKGFGDRRNNSGPGSSCVLMASAAAVLRNKGQCTYAGTKAALVASASVIAKEFAGSGVRVNTVSPTFIASPMTNYGAQERSENQVKGYPFGIGHVDDVANVVVFLLSDRAKWITGQNYIVDCASF